METSTCEPRPTKNRSRKYPDHGKIYGMVKEDPDKPNWGLWNRGDTWYVIYYDRSWTTRHMNLFTQDVEIARKRRDELYRKARALGRGARSKLQFYAQEILRDPKTDHGLKFMVYFGNRVISCNSDKQARAEREKIAKEIIANGKGGGRA